MLRTSNDCCFSRAAHGQLLQCNRKNAATVLRVVVKSHKGLKGTKVFAFGCSGRNLKISRHLQGRVCAGVLSLQSCTLQQFVKKPN